MADPFPLPITLLDKNGSFSVPPLPPGHWVTWGWHANSFWKRLWAALVNEPHRMKLEADGTLTMSWAGGTLVLRRVLALAPKE